MANTDLLAHVLPDEGWYCIMGLNRGMPKQHFVETLEEVSGVVDKLAALGCDVYFGCAKFDSAGVRKQANATHFKAFWLDIDCGYSKPYNSQTEGLQAFGSSAQRTSCRNLRWSIPVGGFMLTGR